MGVKLSKNGEIRLRISQVFRILLWGLANALFHSRAEGHRRQTSDSHRYLLSQWYAAQILLHRRFPGRQKARH